MAAVNHVATNVALLQLLQLPATVDKRTDALAKRDLQGQEENEDRERHTEEQEEETMGKTNGGHRTREWKGVRTCNFQWSWWFSNYQQWYRGKPFSKFPLTSSKFFNQFRFKMWAGNCYLKTILHEACSFVDCFLTNKKAKTALTKYYSTASVLANNNNSSNKENNSSSNKEKQTNKRKCLEVSGHIIALGAIFIIFQCLFMRFFVWENSPRSLDWCNWN